MQLADLDYHLDPDRIAQAPAEPRDSARLLVVERSTGRMEHRTFRELDALLNVGDLLVANDSRVIPARLHARKSTGGTIEVLLLRAHGDEWEALVRGRVRAGTDLAFTSGGRTDTAVVTAVLGQGFARVRFDAPADAVMERHGHLPVPPYIRQEPDDPGSYQTVYARVAGSAAAPTAGLHFTPHLLARLEERGVGCAFVTLHVGTDTFRPITAPNLAGHVMHEEWYHLPAETADEIRRCRARGNRVVAVGTTSVRVLETAATFAGERKGWTDLFIVPGHEFTAVDALITNFHLPRTSLLALVAAFAGVELTRKAYRTAIEQGYRFYSFGDAMLVL
jgi:S-adenosylmethionine:tRNA ribosyltransferase-isomerase